jgi:hypothetical protein
LFVLDVCEITPLAAPYLEDIDGDLAIRVLR